MTDSRAGAANIKMILEHLDMPEGKEVLEKKKKKKSHKEQGMSREHRANLQPENALNGQIWIEEGHQVPVEIMAKRQMQPKA